MEGGVEGVLECGALETIVVADRVFADELHLRCAQDHFESGRRMDFGCLGLIIAMSVRHLPGVRRYLCQRILLLGRLVFRKRSVWKTGLR